MDAQVERSASDERALAFLAIGFAALALILAAVGLYGVLAYSTEQRTREIGVRLALGSPRSVIVLLVVREMAIIAAVATIVALPSLVALGRLFRSQLFGVNTFDPVTLGGAVHVYRNDALSGRCIARAPGSGCRTHASTAHGIENSCLRTE